MLDFHAQVILANIQQTTAGATRRRKSHVGAWAVAAVLAAFLFAAVLAGLLQ